MQASEKKEQIISKMPRIAFVILLLFIGLQSCCLALPWNNKRLPAINPKEKIGYVNINWWDNFSDPYLKGYIIQAIENNHDTKEASWKVEEYKNMIKLQFSQELPTFSVGGTYLGAHFPDNIKGLKNNIFAVPIYANYEADIFLKNHDKTKSSKKAYQSSKYQEKSIYITLASNVATTYINVIKFDKLIQIQHEQLAVACEALKREQAKFNRGTASATSLNNYKNSYEQVKSSLDELVKSRDKALNQLCVLIGESSLNSCCLSRGKWDDFKYVAKIPDSIPSDVVFSRPDIMAAEANLQKASIDVRVARKEFLPNLNIVGLYTFTNLGSNFGSWNGSIAAIVASLAQELFTGGRKVSNLKINKAKYEQMFEAYRQADLVALQEVNDSLILIKEDSKINQNSKNCLNLQTNNYIRAKKSFASGTISYQNLLGAKSAYLNASSNDINSSAIKYIDYITLYKSVGGNL